MPISNHAEHMTDLDVHTHLAPINAARLEHMPGVRWQPEQAVLELDGHRVAVRALFEPARLLEWMRTHAIARALVSIPPPLYRQHLPEDQALEWARYVNQELLAVCASSEGRLSAMLHLPLEHPGLLARLIDEFQDTPFGGVAIAAGGHQSIVYSDEHYAPLWAWLNDRGVFTFLHPGACTDTRLAKFYLENLLGNPYETGVAASHLVLAGIPARYPRIRFCLAHAGGAFTALIGRLQKGFDTQRPGVDLSVEPPLQAARRFYADGIAHHPAGLHLAKEVLGEDKLLFGSDWPFPMGLVKP